MGDPRRIDWRFATLLALLALLAIVLWWTPLLLPFRLFVTLVHELSHALVAVLTGGQVGGISVDLNGGGLTGVRGGNLFLTASAGYVGSSFFGAALLLLARGSQRRLVLQALAVGLLLGLLFFFRNPLAIVAAVVLAGGFWLIAARGPEWAVALFVYWLAVLNGLYAVYDLLVLLRLSGPLSLRATDAAILESVTHVPALFWAVLWTAIAVLIQGLALRAVLAGPAAPSMRAGDLARR